MERLITLAQAKDRLKLTSIADQEDLELMLDSAHGICEDFAKQRISDAATWVAVVDAWTDETVPALMTQAILLQFGAMYRFRGDDEPGVRSGFDNDGLAIGVAGLLRRLKDPAVA